jgi:acyl phosphate:glycerol-3-phosphate acyltransferase
MMPGVVAEYAANTVIGYLLGSIPFGLVVGYLWLGRDIRQSGSGKTGTTNVLRTAGRIPAALVMVADIGKAIVPGLIGRFVFHDDGVAAAGASAAVVGHIWPVFAGFRGGRGVASAFGAVLGLTPLALVFPLIGAALVVPTRYVSLMSVVGTPISATILVIAAAAFGQPWAFALCAVFATLLVEYKHIPNIKRLLAGTEPRMGQGGNRPATG